MSDLEKAKFLLYILSQQDLKLKGSKEAFSFTQSYEWLLSVAKRIEANKDKNGDN